MAKALSVDLRRRVIDAVVEGMSATPLTSSHQPNVATISPQQDMMQSDRKTL
jgi:hypothetical protein